MTLSLIYDKINGSGFYENTNYVPTEWKDKILNKGLKYGQTQTRNLTAEAMYNIENE